MTPCQFRYRLTVIDAVNLASPLEEVSKYVATDAIFSLFYNDNFIRTHECGSQTTSLSLSFSPSIRCQVEVEKSEWLAPR